MPHDEPRHRIKRDGGRAAVERLARTNQRDCARHDDERARLNGNTRPQSGAGDGQEQRVLCHFFLTVHPRSPLTRVDDPLSREQDPTATYARYDTLTTHSTPAPHKDH